MAVYYFVDIAVDVKGKERDETEIKAWVCRDTWTSFSIEYKILICISYDYI